MTAATTPSVARAEAPALQAPAGALGLTLDPVTTPQFLGDHAGRRPLIVARSQPGRFDAVLGDADVERLVCASAIRAPAFRLVKDGAQIPLASYTKDIPWRPGSFAGTALVDRVAQEHARGATIVLQALHLHWHPAALYCRGLETELGWPAQANAYCTPASSQGFGVHHDTHDVFVLQVSGSKRWRIYEPVVELPLKDQRWSAERAEQLGEPLHDITLRAGDTLYMPRGWPHEAAAADSDSLHVTVGLHPPARIDALRDALNECADDVEFRRALASDEGVPDELLERLAGRLRPEAVARRARRRFVDGRRPVLDDQLSQLRALGDLSLDAPLERRSTVIADVARSPDATVLRFEGKEVRFPPRAGEAVAAIAAARTAFSTAQLPGPLDNAGRLVLVTRLVREGFVRQLDR